MAKVKTKFFCKECGYESSGWMGKCPSCNSWNSLVEEKIEPEIKGRGSWVEAEDSGVKAKVQSLYEVAAAEDEVRVKSGNPELDRVLGGGFVRASLILVGGDPGIGKSTLLLQVSSSLSQQGEAVLYVSGEESARQIRMRADRLQLDPGKIKLMTTTNFEAIADEIKVSKVDFVVVDSIQTIYSSELTSAPGSVSQVRETTAGLLRLAKNLGVTIILLGHVTKEGSIAGPRVLEHMVDTVLYFEGETSQNLRILRCVKNRFGNTDELGIFEMQEKGLVPVANPSLAMLAGRPLAVPGTAVSSLIEGTRPILIEIQALLSPSHYQQALRMSQGFDRLRLGMIMAIIEKHLKRDLSGFDCYLNVVGGLRVRETACDLAVAAAIFSSLEEKSLPEHMLILGELGLSGEIRSISFPEKRVQEAERLGWKKIILPASAEERVSQLNLGKNVHVFYAGLLEEAMDLLFAK